MPRGVPASGKRRRRRRSKGGLEAAVRGVVEAVQGLAGMVERLDAELSGILNAVEAKITEQRERADKAVAGMRKFRGELLHARVRERAIAEADGSET